MSLNKYDKQSIPRYKKTANMITKTGPLLDIGARTAILRHYIEPVINYQVIDIDKDSIEKLRIEGVPCMLSNAENIPQHDNYYDTVVMGEVLEHISNMGLVLKEIYRVLNDNGELVISVPNGELKTRLYLALKRFYKIPSIKKCEKKSVIIGGHIHMFNFRHLQLLLKTYNFIIDEYTNKYNDEYIILRCHKYVC